MKKNEKYSERFCNKENEVTRGIFNSENWGKRTKIMTPKQKAFDLVNTFFLPLEESLNANVNTKRSKIAKQHALIAVDEILNFISISEIENIYWINYWQEVKEEINKL